MKMDAYLLLKSSQCETLKCKNCCNTDLSHCSWMKMLIPASECTAHLGSRRTCDCFAVFHRPSSGHLMMQPWSSYNCGKADGVTLDFTSNPNSDSTSKAFRRQWEQQLLKILLQNLDLHLDSKLETNWRLLTLNISANITNFEWWHCGVYLVKYWLHTPKCHIMAQSQSCRSNSLSQLSGLVSKLWVITDPVSPEQRVWILNTKHRSDSILHC